MKVLGIIAEYNPMHTGHIYHISKAKKITGCDTVIVIMSGSFTQQGNIAIINKFERAKQAIQNGVDLVIEIPSAFASSDAGNFAYKSVSILNDLNVDAICFGAETDNIERLKLISETLIYKDKEIWIEIKNELKKGISFAKARNNSLNKFLNEDDINIILSPNNILALEYLKTLKVLNSNIIPFAIHRESNFNSHILENCYTSSTSIRKALENKCNLNDIQKYIPENVSKYLKNNKIIFNNDFFEILKYKIISMNENDLKEINGVSEGIENKLKKEICNSYSYDEFLFKIKSKRYELSRIKRILVNILLNISKDNFNLLKESNSNYAHILAFNHDKKDLLSHISNTSNIPVISSLNNKTLSYLNKYQKLSLDIDIYASNIYSMLINQKINKDYTNFI